MALYSRHFTNGRYKWQGHPPRAGLRLLFPVKSIFYLHHFWETGSGKTSLSPHTTY